MPQGLTDKEMRALRILANSPRPVPAKDLATMVEVSERSARSYVKAINCVAGYELIVGSRSGYTGDKSRMQALLQQNAKSTTSKSIPQTGAERCSWLINRLLRSNEQLNVFDLCEEIFISISTMKTTLAKTRRRLEPFDLELAQQDGMLEIVGTEKNKRRMLAELLYEETSINFLDLETIQRSFPDIDVAVVRECTIKTLDAHRYFVNDYSLINLILHIAVAIERMRSNRPQTSGAPDAPGTTCTQSDLRAHEYDMANELADQLQQRFAVPFPSAERDELALLLASRTTPSTYEVETRDSIGRFIDADCLNLVDTLIKNVEAFYFIDLSEGEFFIRFALHIKNLLVRARHHAYAKNPLTEEIHASCPLLYDAAVSLAGIIKQQRDIQIPDDEIAYIAFHLGSALEAQKQLNAKIKTVLYCPLSFYASKPLRQFIERTLKDDILITDIVTTEAQLNRVDSAELVLATAPINAMSELPTYNMSIIADTRDAESIRALTTRIRRDKRRHAFRQHLEALVTPELFEYSESITTREDAIAHMSAKLERTGYVEKEYEREIWERERLSSTAFGSVAVPHALVPRANASSISILIPRVPLTWGSASVRLVLMLSFSIRQRAVFNELFDPLVQILIDERNVVKLSQIRDYRSFIDALCSMLN